MAKEEKNKNEETKKISQKEITEGKKLVTISKGTKEITRLEHKVPSWMTSEE